MPASAYLFPLIGALIGYVTNFLAVRMIFRPRRPVGRGALRLQGLLPRRKKVFAQRIADVIETHLFSHEDIARALREPGVRTALEAGVDRRLEELSASIVQRFPMAAMFLRGELLEQVRTRILAMAEELLGDVGEHLESSLDVRALIRSKIEDFDLDQLEAIVLAVARRELRFIELAGAILGAIVGTAQMLLLL